MLILRKYGGERMLKIALCDDDKESLQQLCALMEEYRAAHLPELRYTAFTGAFGLLSAIDCGQHFDMVILDVMMPNTNGIQAARQIRQRDERMEILFFSASREYAVESYEVRARNYILKPLTREKFFAVMDQAISICPPPQAKTSWSRTKRAAFPGSSPAGWSIAR